MTGRTYDIVIPVARLLLACVMLIATPAFLGLYQLPIAWLAVPWTWMTFISCYMQGYRQVHLIALCAASVLSVLLGLYGLALLGATYL